MWSEGGWTGPDYAVAYAVGSSPFGPFERVGKILQQDSTVATGAGHHSVIQSPSSGKWYIVYHRRPLGETDRNHRVVSIDEMHFDERGFIQPVRITKEGIVADPHRGGDRRGLTRDGGAEHGSDRPRSMEWERVPRPYTSVVEAGYPPATSLHLEALLP